jgi:hypothetical protein
LRAVDFDRKDDDASQADAVAAAPAPHAVRVTDQFRLSMSRWQSFGAVIVVLAILLGASGIAAYGWVIAHDWGCRIGVIKSYCPASPAGPAVRPPRADIPA